MSGGAVCCLTVAAVVLCLVVTPQAQPNDTNLSSPNGTSNSLLSEDSDSVFGLSNVIDFRNSSDVASTQEPLDQTISTGGVGQVGGQTEDTGLNLEQTSTDMTLSTPADQSDRLEHTRRVSDDLVSPAPRVQNSDGNPTQDLPGQDSHPRDSEGPPTHDLPGQDSHPRDSEPEVALRVVDGSSGRVGPTDPSPVIRDPNYFVHFEYEFFRDETACIEYGRCVECVPRCILDIVMNFDNPWRCRCRVGN
ncbi:uncharacterized protein LOC131951183 [Physella acuta]|uniref:uncharacterized protein LOC131951183 n=1 Tax=Physella acuta TaxID=109671 RepID=UPI0027DE19AD|nr:uncharacterized protein LOC131951183 [Physella acuta]